MRHETDITKGFAIDPWIRALEIPALFAGLDYRVGSLNYHAARLLGLSDPSALRGESLRLLVDKRRAADFFSDLLALQNDDGSLRQATTELSRNGAAHTFTVTALRGQKNAILGFLLQQAPAEAGAIPARGAFAPADDPEAAPTDDGASLAESEWRWKMAVHSASQGVWDHDFERDRHYVSQTWRELRGLGPQESYAASTEEWMETIHPNDVDHIQEELRKLDAGETDVINYKFRQRHARGHWVWFFSKGRVVRRTATGQVARIIGTDTDISEIKKVELESQRMARRLEAALQASGMGRWEYDVGAKYAYWDDQLLEITGLRDGMNIRSSDNWAEIVHPDDREAVVALSERCLAEGRDLNCDYRIVRPDGSVRFIRSMGKYVDDAIMGARYYGVNFDVTEDHERTQALEDARARLEYESRHDALTGLANRRFLDVAFLELSEREASRTRRVAVLHFDIDHFKQINDTLGHSAGDALLKHAADVLTRKLPEKTLVSRVGGDEFVALLEDAPPKRVLKSLAEAIISDMSKPYFYSSQQCNIGTSIGVALSKPGKPLDNSLFIDADLALYEAKKAGRGRVRFFNDEMKQAARRRKTSFDALLEGFDLGEITCHYQPQFDARTLDLAGVEALVRWDSAKFGLMMPDEFLGTAADMGLMADFDEVVLRKALGDLRSWQEAGFDVPRISVNVSSHRLNDPALGQRLARLDLPPGKLAFELLESAFLDLRNDVIDGNLAMLDEMGIEIEIDDFGSGHASIVSLLQIAPKRLKIDRMLVGPIVASKRQRDLVRTIVEIGKMLDVSVIAEGVETRDHARIMREVGCHVLQGFGLARPMDAADLTDLLQQLRVRGGGFLLEPQQDYVSRIKSG